MSNPSVKEYMTRDVEVVSQFETVNDVSKRIVESGHDGFPVCDNDMTLVGFVTASDLLLHNNETTRIQTVMDTTPLVAEKDMKIKSAARIMLRSGRSKLSVVNSSGKLVGIITNTDIIRSQIERVTPGKVDKLSDMLASLHKVEPEVKRENVLVDELIPTQKEVYADELQGRKYELENDLCEPLIVVQSGEKKILTDGHHRVKAAVKTGIESIDSYIIELPPDIEVGLLETSKKQGLHSIDDVEVNKEGEHPLIERTEKLQ